MGMIPTLLIVVLSLWSVVVTALAIVGSRNLRREREQHEDAQAKIGQYQAALTRSEARVKETLQELKTVQLKYLELKEASKAESEKDTKDEKQGESTAAATKSEPEPRPEPLVVIDKFDLSWEIGTLLEHVSRVAAAIRDYSAYTRGHIGTEPNKARYDLLWLSNCIYNLDEVGRALTRGNPRALSLACTDLLAAYDSYLKDSSGYNSRDTFQRLAEKVPLAEVKEAIKSLMMKTAPSSHSAGAQHGGRTLKNDRVFLSQAATTAAEHATH